MDAIYRLGTASAAEIREAMHEPPTYTAVRTLLGILEQKGHVGHRSIGNRYFYLPTVPRDEMEKAQSKTFSRRSSEAPSNGSSRPCSTMKRRTCPTTSSAALRK